MASHVIQVALMSGRSLHIPTTMEMSLKDVKWLAQSGLQTCSGILRHQTGKILDEGQTVGEAGLQPGEVLTLQVRQTALACHPAGLSLSAVMGDGTVTTWGNSKRGGDSSAIQKQLRNVQHIKANLYAFAALLDDGSVVTWGDPEKGGDSSAVHEQLRSVKHIQGNAFSFAALLDDGSVVTWGNPFSWW